MKFQQCLLFFILLITTGWSNQTCEDFSCSGEGACLALPTQFDGPECETGFTASDCIQGGSGMWCGPKSCEAYSCSGQGACLLLPTQNNPFRVECEKDSSRFSNASKCAQDNGKWCGPKTCEAYSCTGQGACLLNGLQSDNSDVECEVDSNYYPNASKCTAEYGIWCGPDPTHEPTNKPTEDPTHEPTPKPTDEPTKKPTFKPADQNTNNQNTNNQNPTHEPTNKPTDDPTHEPTEKPTFKPADQNTNNREPTHKPTEEPTNKPTDQPVDQNTNNQNTNNQISSSTHSCSPGNSDGEKSGCCTKDNPCPLYVGDCNSHEQCEGELFCNIINEGNKHGYKNNKVDVCGPSTKASGNSGSGNNSSGNNSSTSSDKIDAELKLDGDFDAITNKQDWLNECSEVLAPVTCIDITKGSIILKYRGTMKHLTTATSMMVDVGLSLPSYPTYEAIITGESYCEHVTMVYNELDCKASSCCYWNHWDGGKEGNKCHSDIGSDTCIELYAPEDAAWCENHDANRPAMKCAKTYDQTACLNNNDCEWEMDEEICYARNEGLMYACIVLTILSYISLIGFGVQHYRRRQENIDETPEYFARQVNYLSGTPEIVKNAGFSENRSLYVCNEFLPLKMIYGDWAHFVSKYEAALIFVFGLAYTMLVTAMLQIEKERYGVVAGKQASFFSITIPILVIQYLHSEAAKLDEKAEVGSESSWCKLLGKFAGRLFSIVLLILSISFSVLAIQYALLILNPVCFVFNSLVYGPILSFLTSYCTTNLKFWAAWHIVVEKVLEEKSEEDGLMKLTLLKFLSYVPFFVSKPKEIKLSETMKMKSNFIPYTATFIDDEGGEHPNVKPIQISDNVFVYQVNQGGWNKFVAVDRNGNKIENRYSGTALTKDMKLTVWELATRGGSYDVKNIHFCSPRFAFIPSTATFIDDKNVSHPNVKPIQISDNVFVYQVNQGGLNKFVAVDRNGNKIENRYSGTALTEDMKLTVWELATRGGNYEVTNIHFCIPEFAGADAGGSPPVIELASTSSNSVGGVEIIQEKLSMYE